jgi:hypothetical protein
LATVAHGLGAASPSPASLRSAPSPALCKGRGDSEQVFGDMVDGLTQAQLVPVVHRRDPRAPRATATSLAERRAWKVPVDPPGQASW